MCAASLSATALRARWKNQLNVEVGIPGEGPSTARVKKVLQWEREWPGKYLRIWPLKATFSSLFLPLVYFTCFSYVLSFFISPHFRCTTSPAIEIFAKTSLASALRKNSFYDSPTLAPVYLNIYKYSWRYGHDPASVSLVLARPRAQICQFPPITRTDGFRYFGENYRPFSCTHMNMMVFK